MTIKNMNTKLTSKFSFASLLLIVGIGTFYLAYQTTPTDVANAAQASNWSAGQIIDDSIFYNGNDLTVDQIQQFLDAKIKAVGGCDTNGTQPSEYGGGTRAQYGASRGYPAPYTCLSGYYENPTTHANNLSGNPIPDGALSAAQIIKNAATTYSISARALLVIIQKESPGPLLTDTWPFPNQYTNALGYGCPDTAACDPQYAGFYNQVNNAAHQFVLYKSNPTAYRTKPLQTNSVLYNPTSSCGASSVYIESSATAGLYNYTPYQPNQAALNNLYGSGDSCSSYGNRNFWRMFNDWFGDTLVYVCSNSEPVQAQVTSYYNPTTFQHFYTSYACEGNVLTQKLGYRNEGAVFNTTDPASVASAAPVYRLYNSKTFQHLWTTSQAEVQSAQQAAGYQYEGIAFYVAPPDAPGVQPVNRLYNPKTFQHIWTPNTAVSTYLTQNTDFKLEGAAFYTQ